MVRATPGFWIRQPNRLLLALLLQPSEAIPVVHQLAEVQNPRLFQGSRPLSLPFVLSKLCFPGSSTPSSGLCLVLLLYMQFLRLLLRKETGPEPQPCRDGSEFEFLVPKARWLHPGCQAGRVPRLQQLPDLPQELLLAGGSLARTKVGIAGTVLQVGSSNNWHHFMYWKRDSLNILLQLCNFPLLQFILYLKINLFSTAWPESTRSDINTEPNRAEGFRPQHQNGAQPV